MDISKGYHRSVLIDDVLNRINIVPGEWYLDGTLGDGGYSVEILKRGGSVVGVDVDPEAIKRTQQRFDNNGIEKSNYKLIQGNFRDIKNLIKKQTGFRGMQFKGVVLDLGVSSLQLGDSERGFSFIKDAPLDMRMDPNLQVTAADLVNGLNRGELYELFTKLGEEKYSRRVADVIVSSREISKLGTTKQLADLVERVYRGFKMKSGKIHPATRVFQALRIAVNDELNVLKEVLPHLLELTHSDGRVLVISFHSLEDRIVKTIFKKWQDEGIGEILTKKPLVPTDLEVKVNPRSRSAKLRVFRKR